MSAVTLKVMDGSSVTQLSSSPSPLPAVDERNHSEAGGAAQRHALPQHPHQANADVPQRGGHQTPWGRLETHTHTHTHAHTHTHTCARAPSLSLSHGPSVKHAFCGIAPTLCRGLGWVPQRWHWPRRKNATVQNALTLLIVMMTLTWQGDVPIE